VIERFRAAAAGACVMLAMGTAARAQTSPPPATATHRETVVTTRASGTFEVKMNPQPADPAWLGRFSFDKQFHGGLEGTSQGVMLAAGTPAAGSGGYVAMEQVTGALNGRSGTFVLQHNGTMSPGSMTLSVTVVPGSGTGELAGLAGTFAIIIADGKHSYDFDYTLPDAH
jgi:hypothetical protein